MRIVSVPVDHRVHVHVPQAGEHTHAFRRDHRRITRNGEGSDCPYRRDAFAVDEDHRVTHDRPAEAIDQGAADERDTARCLRSAALRRREDDERREQTCYTASLRDDGHERSNGWGGGNYAPSREMVVVLEPPVKRQADNVRLAH